MDIYVYIGFSLTMRWFSERCFLQKLKQIRILLKCKQRQNVINKIQKENMYKYSSWRQGAKLQPELAANATENWLFATRILMLIMLAGIDWHVKCQGLWNYFVLQLKRTFFLESLLQMVTEFNCLINTWQPSKEVTLR